MSELPPPETVPSPTVPDRLRDWDHDHLWHPLTVHAALWADTGPLMLVEGHGATVIDASGQSYLDATGGLWCVNVGYGRQELVEAAADQMARLPFFPLTQSHPPAIRLARRLAELLPGTPRVFFTNSGSEANEVAFKVIRQYWRRRGQPERFKILGRDRAYHGSTLATLAAGGQAARRQDYGPLPSGFGQVVAPYCHRCPFQLTYPACDLRCADDFDRRIQQEGPETVAAVIVEPITAGGGVLVPPDDYLARVDAICRSHRVKLIVDEVVTGFGRVGAWFGHQERGAVVSPDVVTMAKGLASGYQPIGAAAFADELFHTIEGTFPGTVPANDAGDHFRHVNTYGGHPVAAAVALANLDVLSREGLPTQSRVRGARLLDGLTQALAGHPQVRDIRGRGLLVGIELGTTPGDHNEAAALTRRVVSELRTRGVLVGRTTDVGPDGDNIVILAPPLVIAEDEVDRLVDAVAATVGVAGSATI